MKIGYFGSPDISARLLEALLEDGSHEIVCVVSNADRARGRSGKPRPTETSEVALKHDLPLYRFETLKDASAAEALAKHEADLFLVFAYGKILPPAIFEMPPLGTINLHGSLLPLLRGASPIQTAILEGFQETGWTLQKLAAAMDAGDIISTRVLSIDPAETSGELFERMLPEGIDLTIKTLADFHHLVAGAMPQDHDAATFCSKFDKSMSLVDWNRPAGEIHNLIRALNPWPSALARMDGKQVKLHRSMPPETDSSGDSPASRAGDDALLEAKKQLHDSPPGTVVTIKKGGPVRLFARTGAGILELLELQPESKKAMKAADFINGFRLQSGASFE